MAKIKSKKVFTKQICHFFFTKPIIFCVSKTLFLSQETNAQLAILLKEREYEMEAMREKVSSVSEILQRNEQVCHVVSKPGCKLYESV